MGRPGASRRAALLPPGPRPARPPATPPPASPQAASATPPIGSLPAAARGTAPAFINTAALEGRDSWELSQKNVQALRTLFNIAHRLSDNLGKGWLYVMDVLNALDRVIGSPAATTQVGARAQQGLWDRAARGRAPRSWRRGEARRRRGPTRLALTPATPG